MGTTVQQVAGETSSTPINGQPWNFHGLLETYIIPRTVAADRNLPPGARLLWGIIRQHAFRDGRCFASDETLANALAVSDRQFRRHVCTLQKAGLLQSTPRPGKTPIRELLWDSRFAGKIPPGRTDRSGGADTNDRGSGQIRPDHIRNRGVLKGVLKGEEADGLKKPSPKPAAPPAQKPAAEWTEQDYIARGRAMGFPEHVIQRDVERARARKAKPQAERMVKASELTSELEAAIRR